MKNIRTKGGFSLVELLTVIAIIAILAAIIFPAMTAVKTRAKLTQCMTNMHDIAMALQHYQMDNRRYPNTLAPVVITDSTGAIEKMEQVTVDDQEQPVNGLPGVTSLYPEYINTVKGFHCPLADNVKTTSYVIWTNPATNAVTRYYAYDDYDVYLPSPTDGATAEVRYWPSWAPSPDAVLIYQPADPALVGVSPSDAQAAAAQAYDYKRQLRFRNPPKDTVVTWCSYHGNARGTGMIPVLFLDGHCDQFAQKDVVGVSSPGMAWRTMPHL